MNLCEGPVACRCLEVFIPVLGPIVELAPGSVVISKESCTVCYCTWKFSSLNLAP